MKSVKSVYKNSTLVIEEYLLCFSLPCQSERAYQARVIPQGRSGDYQILDISRRNDVLFHSDSDRLDEQICAFRYAASKDHYAWVENMQEIGQGAAEVCAGALEGSQSQLVTLPGCLGDIPRSHRLYFGENYKIGYNIKLK